MLNNKPNYLNHEITLKIFLLIAIFIFPLNSYGQFKVDFKKKVINQTNSRLIRLPIKLSAKDLMPLRMG